MSSKSKFKWLRFLFIQDRLKFVLWYDIYYFFFSLSFSLYRSLFCSFSLCFCICLSLVSPSTLSYPILHFFSPLSSLLKCHVIPQTNPSIPPTPHYHTHITYIHTHTHAHAHIHTHIRAYTHIHTYIFQFLKLTGRIKEQFKIENGKYIVPAPLEVS